MNVPDKNIQGVSQIPLYFPEADVGIPPPLPYPLQILRIFFYGGDTFKDNGHVPLHPIPTPFTTSTVSEHSEPGSHGSYPMLLQICCIKKRGGGGDRF